MKGMNVCMQPTGSYVDGVQMPQLLRLDELVRNDCLKAPRSKATEHFRPRNGRKRTEAGDYLDICVSNFFFPVSHNFEFFKRLKGVKK